VRLLAWLLVGSALSGAACVPDDGTAGARPGGGPGRAAPPVTRPAPAAPPRPGSPAAPGVASGQPAAPAAGGDPAADPLLTAPFVDRFDGPALGADWAPTTPGWRVESGRLCVDHAKNHPVWLRRRLPKNARIEFDAMSASDDGDLKAEFWGDGKSAADTVSYDDATSYLTIFGGWKNSFHVLARIDEHAPGRPEVRLEDESDDLRTKKVRPNRAYHFKVVRDDGRTVRWSVDDAEILTYPDPQPLAGPGHDHFGFNDWDVRVCFDNLAVTPLP
jgi:hypothetical protein